MDTATPQVETFATFAARMQLQLRAHRSNNPPAERLNGYRDGSHYRCYLIAPRGNAFGNLHKFGFWYSMGSAHTDAPNLADVLESLAVDASCYENARDFADFAADMGMDTDSRKAERTYRACGRTAGRLAYLLGPDNYRTLLAVEG